MDACAQATQDFTGSEIAELIVTGLYAAYADGKREIATADIIAAAKNTTPLVRTQGERLTKLREWAKGRARPASTPEQMSTKTAREVEL
jgi:hypothetical protein